MSVVRTLMPSMLAIVQMGTNWSLSIWDIRYKSFERFSLEITKQQINVDQPSLDLGKNVSTFQILQHKGALSACLLPREIKLQLFL